MIKLSDTSTDEGLWEHAAPQLDEALAALGEIDRQAVLLRFFEKKSLAEVGDLLGVGDEAARKRVARALEKLRRFFSKRKIALSTATLASLLAAKSVAAAPAGFASSVFTGATAGGATGGALAITKSVQYLMTIAKLKQAGLSVAAIAVVATAVIEAETVQGEPQTKLRPAAAAIEPRNGRDGYRSSSTNLAAGIQNAIGPSFSYSPTDLIFQGQAAFVAGRLRLTPAAQGKVGAVWLRRQRTVRNGFEVSFRFQLSDFGGHGADGLAFVIQGGEIPRVGLTGEHAAIPGGSNVFGVKFDNYHWQGGNYVKYGEVAVLTGNSVLADSRSPGESISISQGVDFSDGTVHSARIVYIPGNLQIYLDDMNTPLISARFDLQGTITTPSDRVWVGLTAATGADYQNHDILDWSFHEGAASPASEGVLPRVAARSVTPQTEVYSAASPATPALSKDPAFGYRVPGVPELNYRVEASTDLKTWTPLTNLVLYFTDPESTNYNHRFYKFVPRE